MQRHRATKPEDSRLTDADKEVRADTGTKPGESPDIGDPRRLAVHLAKRFDKPVPEGP